MSTTSLTDSPTLEIPESLEKKINHLTVTLISSQVLQAASVPAVFTVSGIIAVGMAGGDWANGIPSALNSAGRALAAYPIGVLMQRYGRRIGMSSAFMVGVVGAIIAFFAAVNGWLYPFFFGSLLFGMMRAGGDQGRFIAAEIQPQVRRAKAIGTLLFVGSLGSIFLGPLLVPRASDLFVSFGFPENTGALLLPVLFLTVAAGVLTIFLRPDPREVSVEVANFENASQDSATEKITSSRTLSEIFASPMVRLAAFSMIFGQVVMVTLMISTPLHMDHHNHGLDTISLVIMTHTAGMFLLAPVTGWLVDKVGPVPVILTGAIICIIASIIMPISPRFVSLATALYLVGLGWNFCFVAGSSLFSNSLRPEERSRAQGANETAVAIGAGLANLASGLIYGIGGVLFVGVLGVALSLVLLVITLVVMRVRV